MEASLLIRDTITTYISQHNITINKFAERSGIHSATLTRIMKSQQAFNMGHLDKVTATLGLKKDHFYDSYVDECLHLFAPTWRRIRPFIQCCAEAERVDCIKRLVEGLLDDLAYVPMLFELAEELFDQKYLQAAAVLYENVALSEKLQHSERLAVCKFRLFTISVGDDRDENLCTAVAFEPYIERLEGINQLEALKQLGHIHASLGNWQKSEEISLELLRVATMQYEQDWRTGCLYKERNYPESGKYFYILYAHIMRATSYEERGDYRTVLEILPHSFDGRGLRETNEPAKRMMALFQEWGTANVYSNRVMSGQEEAVTEYANYISDKDSEVFLAVFKIVEAANRYGWNVDEILVRFSDYIPYGEHLNELGKHNKQIYDEQYIRFQNELAKYYLTRKQIEQSDISISGTDLSATFDPERKVIKGKLSVEFEVEF